MASTIGDSFNPAGMRVILPVDRARTLKVHEAVSPEKKMTVFKSIQRFHGYCSYPTG